MGVILRRGLLDYDRRDWQARHRMTARLRIGTALAIAVLALPASASANVKNSHPGWVLSARYDHWLARSALPLPARLRIVTRPGASDAIAETVWPDKIIIYAPALFTRRTLFHEVGHVFNLERMDAQDEARFTATVFSQTYGAQQRFAANGWWRGMLFGGTPFCESFAEIYSVLARHPAIPDADSNRWDNGFYLTPILTRAQTTAARQLIRSFAAGKARGESDFPR